MDLRTIGVVIPAYNAAKTISGVIEQLTDYGFDKKNVIVVNDGSADKTADIVRSMGVALIDVGKNKGKGAALRAGFTLAREAGLDKVFVIDADGQHDVRDISNFLALNGRYDILIGERQNILESMPLARRWTNRTVNLVVSLLAKSRTSDVQCGLRCINLKIFKKMVLKTSRYETESEMVIKAARRRCSVGFVPIKTIYATERSYVNPLVDTIRFINMSVRSLWR